MSGFMDVSKLAPEHRRLLKVLAAEKGNYLSRGIRGTYVVRDRTGKRQMDQGITWPTLERLHDEGWLTVHGGHGIMTAGSMVASAKTIDLFTAHDQRG